MQKLKSLPQITLLLVVTIILGGIVVFRPYWGLMDDAMHLFISMPELEKVGVFRGAWEYGVRDLAWGMFRPTYMLMVYVLYKPGLLLGPSATYFLNALMALFGIFLCTSVLSRILEIKREWALVATAAFFYQYDLFQHPSLQEKLLLISGALLIRLSNPPIVFNRTVHFTLFAAVFIFGVFVKASFMIFFSMALWVYLSIYKESLILRKSPRVWASVLAFIGAGFGALIFLAKVSSREGGYTQGGYKLANVVPNMLSVEGIFFITPLALFSLWLVLRPKFFISKPEKMTAFWGVLAFLVIFLPWGIKAYVQSVIGPVFACLCVQLAQGLFGRVPAKIWQVPLAIIAVSIAAYRVPTMFIRLGDIGKAVAAVPLWEQKGVQEIFLPCWEGADSMRSYVKEFAGSSLKVSRLKEFNALEGKAVFFDLALCPLPNRADEILGCSSQEVLFKGRMKKSFQLVRGTGCS